MSVSLQGLLGAALARAGNAVGDELFPILVWLTVFGATRLAPSLILRLSIAVPQTMDVPALLRWRRTSSASGLTADELSTRLADFINHTPSGTSRRVDGGGDAAAALLSNSPTWTRFSHRLWESVFSVFTYPQRLLTYLLFQHSQRPALQASDAAQRGRPVVVRLLLRLVTSFTATWVHASGNMLYDTLVTYLSTRLGSWSNVGAPGRSGSARVSSGWRDVLMATCVSTSVNFFLQSFYLQALTSAGELRVRPSPAAMVSGSDVDPTSSFSHVVLSTLARLGSKDTLYRLGRMALQPQQQASSPSLRAPATPPPPTVDSAGATAARPARVYLCGGNAFVFALSGFRLAFYGDYQQLTTSAANIVTDALDLILRQAHQRAAAQQCRRADVSLGAQLWVPSAGLQAAGAATSHDVVLTPASSMQLLPIYVANFAVGAGAGLLWRERPLLLACARRVPGVRSLLAVLAPLPPPPLSLPDALQELSPECNVLLVYANGAVEVAGEERAAPIVKRDDPAPLTVASPAAAAGSVPSAAVPVRVVVAPDLFCPIKRTVMCDPVRTVDGFTYDRDAIEAWLRVHDTAPLTNLHLGSTTVAIDWATRTQIERVVAQYVSARCAATL